MGIKEFVKSNPYISCMAYNALNAKIAYNQQRENRDVLARIQTYKNKYQGKRCFIIGTGPSLTVTDLEMIKDEYSFGTNRIFELFSKTTWRPTFYVNQDHDLIKRHMKTISELEIEHKFVPIEYKKDFGVDKMNFFVLRHQEFYPKAAPFSRNIEKYLAQGFTVTYGAIQLAVYMGFSEIYLLGIDHNYAVTRDSKGNIIKTNNGKQGYAVGMSDYINMNNLPRIEETTIAFETAECLSYKYNYRIYNCTRGGKLEAFERKLLEDVIFEKGE